jgi:tRNA threonylcarbamoyladenosine modification (KEOPS) complex Cgi121 subunit
VAAESYLIKVASSKLSIEELLDRCPKESCIQLFDEGAIACREHLAFAYLNAVRIRERGDARSKSMAMELLLCAAMTSQIGDAIRRVGAKSSRRFIVFADSKRSYGRISKYLENASDFGLKKKEKEARVRRLGIASGKVEDLIQEIALHAMDR